MPKAKPKKEVICLIGPTAVGKTAVALKLAKVIDAEIISCDSMQIYRGVDIASGQEDLHLLASDTVDCQSPAKEYNAAVFCSSAAKIIRAIHRRGKLPLIVGGTGLYLRSLLDGMFKGPGQNIALRRKLYRQAEKYGPAYLYKRLVNKDPQAAGRIHQHDLRRIIRALEVYAATGEPISRLQQKRSGIRDQYKLQIFGLSRKRPLLYQLIEERVEAMFRRGLVAEITRLNRGKLSQTAKFLLGYKEIKGFLNRDYTLDQAKTLLKRNTRRYAKRQLTWFRKEKGVRWLEVGPADTAEIVAKKIHAFLA